MGDFRLRSASKTVQPEMEGLFFCQMELFCLAIAYQPMLAVHDVVDPPFVRRNSDPTRMRVFPENFE